MADQLAQSLIELPSPYLHGLGTPLIYYNGRFIQTGAENVGQSLEKASAESSYFQIGTNNYSLEEIATPGQLEELYWKHNQNMIEQAQAGFLRTFSNSEFTSSQQLSEKIKENKVLSLIIDKILPVITSDSLEDKIDEFLIEGRPAHSVSNSSQAADSEAIDLSKIPPEIAREAAILKQNTVARINAAYASYTINIAEIHNLSPKTHSARNQQNSNYANLVPTNLTNEPLVDQKIKQIFTNRQGLYRQGIEDQFFNENRSEQKAVIRFPALREDSVFSNILHNANCLIIDKKLYALYTFPQLIEEFKGDIASALYSNLQTLPATLELSEIVDYINENKEGINHRALSRIINKLSTSHLKIDGKYYIPLLAGTTEELEATYKKMIEWDIKIDAVEHNEHQMKLCYKLAAEKKRLEELVKSKKFEKNGAGWEIVDGYYWVYITTPAYALKSPHRDGDNCYCEFPSAKIGMKIIYGNNGGYGRQDLSGEYWNIGAPVVMNRYSHPFLPGNATYQNICLGSWNDPLYDKKSVDKRILTYLNQGKKTLMMGYQTGRGPHRRLTTENFSNWITKEDVEKKKLVCLTEHVKYIRPQSSW